MTCFLASEIFEGWEKKQTEREFCPDFSVEDKLSQYAIFVKKKGKELKDTVDGSFEIR